MAKSCERLPLRESKAPALIRLSITLRLTRRESTRLQKSSSELYGPFFSRSSMIEISAALADVFHRRQAEADAVVDDREILERFR